MYNKPNRNFVRKRRHMRVRRKIQGTTARPRLNVFRSLKNIYAQIIDDHQGMTLVAASSLAPELKGTFSSGGNKEAAAAVGKMIAQKAIDKGITEVVFDRAGNIYHGRVKALADAAREGGLKF